jgi:hypothetical protein
MEQFARLITKNAMGCVLARDDVSHFRGVEGFAFRVAEILQGLRNVNVLACRERFGGSLISHAEPFL